MADQKISQLNNITGADVDDATDELAIVDASANETKAITRGELFSDVSKITTTGDVQISGALVVSKTDLTISAGAVTATGSYHTIDTEASAASDDLNTINGAFASGHRLVITSANSGRTVVVKDGTGNIILTNLTGNFSMNNTADTMELIWNGSNWLELSRSKKGA